MKSMAYRSTPTPVLDLLPSLLTTKTNRPPESLWESIDYLSTELVRAGYEKPKKPRGRPTKLIEDEDEGPATWPLGNMAPLPNFAPPGTNAHRQYQVLLDTYESFRRETAKAKET